MSFDPPTLLFQTNPNRILPSPQTEPNTQRVCVYTHDHIRHDIKNVQVPLRCWREHVAISILLIIDFVSFRFEHKICPLAKHVANVFGLSNALLADQHCANSATQQQLQHSSTRIDRELIVLDDDEMVACDGNDNDVDDDEDIINFFTANGQSIQFHSNAYANRPRVSARRHTTIIHNDNDNGHDRLQLTAMSEQTPEQHGGVHEPLARGQQDVWYNVRFSDLMKFVNADGRYECPREFCHKSYKDASSLQRHIRCVLGGC